MAADEVAELRRAASELPLEQPLSQEFAYDAFATHATDPDGELVRIVEAALEGYHRRAGLPRHLRIELELCVDGRDFVFPRSVRSEQHSARSIEAIVRNYQRQCRALLVFSGPTSRDHPWVNDEIRWWQEERPSDPIYFVLTHGPDPLDKAKFMPPALLERGGADNEIFFDFRGFYRRQTLGTALRRSAGWLRDREASLHHGAAKWSRVRRFEEELTKLAALLVANATHRDIAVADLEEAYAAAERRRRWRTIGGVTFAVLLIMALVSAFVSNYAEYQARRQQGLWNQADAFSRQIGPGLQIALSAASTLVAETDNVEAKQKLQRVMQFLLPIERTFSLNEGASTGGETHVVRLLDGARLAATGDRNGVLNILTLRNGTNLASLPLDMGRIRAIEYLEHQRLLVLGGDRGVRAVKIIGDTDNTSDSLRIKMVGSMLTGDRIGDLAIDAERSQVIFGNFSGEIYFAPLDNLEGNWSAERIHQIMDPRFFEKGWYDVPSSVFGMKLLRNGLFVSGIDGVLTVFDYDGASLTRRWQHVHPHVAFSMDVSENGEHIAVADDDGSLTIYTPANGEREHKNVSAVNPASLAPDAGGQWTYAPPDEVLEVGIAVDPTGAVVAVAGLDNMVRFYLLDDLSLLGAVLHAGPTRGTAFAEDGMAYTFGDDGVILATRPLANQYPARVAGVDGFVTLPDKPELVFWSAAEPVPDQPTKHDVFRLDVDSGEIELLSSTSFDLTFGPGMIFGDHVAIRQTASTGVPVLPLRSVGNPCPTERLEHSNTDDNVQIVKRLLLGRSALEIATVTALTADDSQKTLTFFSTDDCAEIGRIPFEGSEKLADVATGAAVVAGGAQEIIIHMGSGQATITFDTEVRTLAIGPEGRTVLTALEDGALCRCSKTERPSASRAGNCPARSRTHTCQSQHVAWPQADMHISDVHLSESGQLAVVLGSRASIAVATASSDWAFHPVARRQLRPITSPFAISPDETLIAVPAGETGVAVLDADTREPKAYLPTPSRVMKLGFLADGSNRVVSLDSDVLRVWTYDRNELVFMACRRWPPHVQVAAAEAKTRPELCGDRFEAVPAKVMSDESDRW